jgi:hypothetical protein
VLALLEGEADLAVWPGDLPPPRAVLRRELATADGQAGLAFEQRQHRGRQPPGDIDARAVGHRALLRV